VCLTSSLLFTACTTKPKQSEPQSSIQPSIQLSPQPLPASVLYAPGPSTSLATLTRDAATSTERRTRSALARDNTWLLTIEEATGGGGEQPGVLSDAAFQTTTRLTLSEDADGILLHELFNASRNSTATFSPPLRLFPASLAPDSAHAASSAARIAEGRSTRTAKATATAAFVHASDPPHLTTRLRITTGPAIIDRDAKLLLTWNASANAWIITREAREFSVRVGPLTIESDDLIATPLP
jgi:hypothetical protein